MISQAGYSLEVAEKALPLYEQFFDLEYPLPKFDTFIVGFARLFLFSSDSTPACSAVDSMPAL